MPDYTSILRRSLSALPDASPAIREAVYERARAALARQLTTVDPPLSSRDIEAQHQELEDAVLRVEADFLPDEAELVNPDPIRDSAFGFPVAAAGAGQAAAIDPPYEERERREASGDYAGDSEDYDEYDDEAPSRAPLLIGLLLLLLVLVGAGAYAYAERGTILALLGFSETGEPSAPETAAGPAAPADTGPAKVSDRLGGEPETPLPAPPAPAATLDAPLEVPAGEQGAIEPLPGGEPAEAEGEQMAALEQPGESIVAQRAIYYFQGAEGTPGQATEGTVAWAQIARDDGPAVQATLRITEQDVTTTVTIYRNSDPSLPASHLVEVQFSGELGQKPIQRVPALVLKETEQARGEPLTGAAVPVTEQLFWIALSDDPDQVARNLQLLRQGSWFDVPILFTDGTRALLTFEKGIPGDRVFETVMSTWNPS